MIGGWNPNDLIGTQLGSCVLERPLGVGGMGAVYLAQQSRPRRQVAVKVLAPQHATNPDAWRVFLARFRREADAAASLDHANIVPIFEFGQEGTIAFLVMPYLPDGSLAALLMRAGRLPLPHTTAYVEQIAAALDYAHEHGLVHRDVKPSNLLLHPDGRLLLTDFGIARPADPPQAPVAGRAAGDEASIVIMGTPEYMAPEQIRGGPVTPAADIYALGNLTYAMLAGQTPFSGDETRIVLARHLTEAPRPLRSLRPDVPPRVEEALVWALAKNPADRPPSAGAFARELSEAARGRSIAGLFARGERRSGALRSDAPRGMLRLAGAVAGLAPNEAAPGDAHADAQEGVEVPHMSQPEPPAPRRRSAPPSGAAQPGLLSGRVAGTSRPPAEPPSLPGAGAARGGGRATNAPSAMPGIFPEGYAEANAPTLYDASAFGAPGLPAWPGAGAAAGGAPGAAGRSPLWPGGTPAQMLGAAGHVRRHSPLVKLFAVGAVALLGFVLLLGGLSRTTLFAQTPNTNTPRVAVSPTATVEPSPTATPTPPPNWLKVSVSSLQLGCRGRDRQQTITLQNLSDQDVDWHVDGDNAVRVSRSQGTLSAHGKVSITVTNDASFFGGGQQGKLQFVPETDGAGNPAVVRYTTQDCFSNGGGN